MIFKLNCFETSSEIGYANKISALIRESYVQVIESITRERMTIYNDSADVVRAY